MRGPKWSLATVRPIREKAWGRPKLPHELKAQGGNGLPRRLHNSSNPFITSIPGSKSFILSKGVIHNPFAHLLLPVVAPGLWITLLGLIYKGGIVKLMKFHYFCETQ